MGDSLPSNGVGRKTALFLGEVVQAIDKVHDLEEIVNIITPKATNRDEFLEEARSGKLDGCEAILRTFDSVSITGLIDRELVEVLPKSVRFLSHLGAGYDQIDVGVCTEFGIRVSNVPTAVDDSTADTNLFLILGALRGFNPSMIALRDGKWRGSPSPRLGHDPQGKVLGILGMGGIGRNLKQKTDALGMITQYHNRTRLSDELSGGAKYVSFVELLQTSDVISLNLPLNNHTKHIISTPEFEKMKKGVVIVNTARGAVMDEAALVAALNSGKVWSCGLDVFENEPKIHAGLINHPHAILLPHMGTWTVETQRKMEVWCLENVKMALLEGRLKSPVPEQRNM